MRAACLRVLIIVLCCPGAPARAADYAVGADLSFLKQAEDRGTVFKDAGKAKPGLRIFKDHGYNWVRLRLFHSPKSLPNNLEYTIALASAAREQGFRFLLDFHPELIGLRATGPVVTPRIADIRNDTCPERRNAGRSGLRVQKQAAEHVTRARHLGDRDQDVSTDCVVLVHPRLE
jgi:hypothetical protein